MKPRSIGIVAGGEGPYGSDSMFRDIINECKRKYGSMRSYEYPCITLYSFPYSEMLLIDNNYCSFPSRELSYSIQQLKHLGMEIIVIPCFTMSSYLTFRNYGVELIEMGPLLQSYLEKNKIHNPLILCSDRTRQSQYCDTYFECKYPDKFIQKKISFFLEETLRGKKINIQTLLSKLPDRWIIGASTILNVQLQEINDARWINPNKLIAEFVVSRSFEASF